MDNVVRTRVLSHSLVRVKLWTAAGASSYSDDTRLIGQTFPIGEQGRQRAALPSQPSTLRCSDLQSRKKTVSAGPWQVLEVCVPAGMTPSGGSRAFRDLLAYQEVTRRTCELWRGVAG